MIAKAGHGEKKSRKSGELIVALLTQPTIEAAARIAGISNASAWRWMQDPVFAESYREAKREAMRHTSARLQAATCEAVDCLRAVQNSGESESARVGAARTILEMALRAADLEDVQRRLSAIEERLRPRIERA